MKKKMIMTLLMVSLTAGTLTLSGCGDAQKSDEEATESTTETAGEEAGKEADEKTEGADGSASDKTGDTGVNPESIPEEVDGVPVVLEAPTFENIDEFITCDDTTMDLVRMEGLDVSGYSENIGQLVGWQMNFGPEDTVDYGMTVTLDYKGSVDGEYFDGGSADDAQLVIGSHQFIGDFEDQLVGAKVGDDVDVYATFPENYGKEELNGKEAHFECHIKAMSQDPWSALVNRCTLKKIPADYFATLKANLMAQYESMAAQYGVETSALLEMAGKTEESINKETVTEVKKALAGLAMMKAAGITEDAPAYTALVDEIMAASGFETVDDAYAAGISDTQMAITNHYYGGRYGLLKMNGCL
ncbi:MAG: FKBP-type peptidyl-prolyl cis-trans isomerase [Lachnospiraceae bacterium]|nr:FKBP-type peptidyl-prolyl cis-trans isomerase [Lachnospiraceae bacterium]